MLEIITSPIINVINSTYLFILDVGNSLRFLDSPGTYILWMVMGAIYIPFFMRGVYEQYANPHGFYSTPLVRKIIMGIIFITAWLVFGYVNFLRFLR